MLHRLLVGQGFRLAGELLLGVWGFSKGPFSPQSASMLQTGKPAGKPAAAWKGCPTEQHSRNQIAARSGRRNRGSDKRSALGQKAKDTLDTRLQPRRMASSRHEETRLKPHVQKSSRRGKKPRCSSTRN